MSLKTRIDAIGTVAYTSDSKAKIDAARLAFDAVLTADQANVTNKQTLLDAETKYEALKADHEAAEAVDTLIGLIPNPVDYTTECKEAIDDAREAYDDLTTAQKALVDNYDDLLDAETAYATLKADNDAADVVIAKINTIGTVTYPTSETAIKAARNAYNALTANQQALVTNYNTLTNAETEFANQKANYEVAQTVVAKINAIGAVKYPTSETAIKAARTAYNALTAAQKALVTNYNTLTADENTYKEVDDVFKTINAIGAVTYSQESKDKINGAREAYDNLSDDEKELLPNYQKLVDSEAQYNKLAKENQTSTGWTIGLIAACGVIVLAGVVYIILYPNKKNKEEE